MPLFSDEYLISLPEPLGSNRKPWQENPWAVQLAKSPEFFHLRKLIELYYARIPNHARSDLAARMLSRQFHTSKAAINEIFLVAVLDSIGLSPRFQPIISRKSPDILITEKDDARIIIEVFTKLPSTRQIGAHNRIRSLLNSVYDKGICQAPGIDLHLDIPKTARINLIVQQIHRNVAYFEKMPESIDLKPYGISGQLFLNKCVIGFPASFGWNIRPLLSKIAKKQKRYKELAENGEKLVVAVFNDDYYDFRFDDLDVALFGNMTYIAHPVCKGQGRIAIEDGNIERSGGFFGISRDGQARNGNIAAVIYVKTRFSENGLFYHMNLIHNPFAKRPLDLRTFERFPQLIFRKEPHQFSSQWSLNRAREYVLLQQKVVST